MLIRLNWPHPEPIRQFVRSRPDAAIAHDPVWLEVLRDGLKHTPMSLTAWRDEQVIGYLPLAAVRSVLFGRHLVSLPYVNEAGVLADEPATAQALIEEATQLGRKHRAPAVELRHRTTVDIDDLDALRSDKKRMTLALPQSSDTLWNDLKAKVRNQVRKADKHALTVHFGDSEWLDAFYRVFSVNMRDLGTPVFPKRLFGAMLHHLGENAELCVVTHERQPIAGAILVHSDQTTEVPSASSLQAFRHTCVNMKMYWAMLCRAIERGASTFDFGRSSEGCGTYKFKTQWGAVAEDTGWQQISLATDAAPITKEDSRFAAAIEVWKRLPVWVTRLAGPPIVRGIP